MAEGFHLVVKGVEDVNKAFTKISTKVDPAIGKELREIAKPVQQTAQSLAVANISQVGGSGRSWSRMRIGRKKVMVYVAERQHGSGGSPRPNFFPLIMREALEPALDTHRSAVRMAISNVLDKLIRRET